MLHPTIAPLNDLIALSAAGTLGKYHAGTRFPAGFETDVRKRIDVPGGPRRSPWSI